MRIKQWLRSGVWILAAILLLAETLVVGGARAAETNNYSGPEWRLLGRDDVLQEAAGITPQKYPNADSVTVDGKSVRKYRADGTGESQDESFTKVLTEKGRRDQRSVAFGFMLPYTTVSVPRLEICKPDGRVEVVDVAANSKESIDDSQMAENIYDPNSRVLRVNIPRLDIGDVVHLVARQTTCRPLIPGEFDDENLFEGAGDIHHLVYEVLSPAAVPLARMALRDAIPGTITASVATNRDDSRVYRWEIRDVPRMYDEADMPPYEMVLQRLFVSTCPAWAEISQWYWNLSEGHLAATTPEMRAEVDRLTHGLTTDQAKMQALFYYVSKNVRYMGLTPEKDRPGFEPHDVGITFQKNYGVCRDKAALLVAMLRLAGFKAYPVLINIGARRDPEVPEPDFDHAIACVQLPDGHYQLMDPTDENTRDFLPSYDCNRSFLVCRPEGDTLRTSPVPPVAGHLMRVDTTGVLSADGQLEARTSLEFDGVNDDEYRNAFSHMKADDEQRFFERALKSAMPGARLLAWKLSPDNLLDMSARLRAELQFSVAGMTVNGGGKAVVSLPWIGQKFGVVNFLLSGADLDRRKYPLETEVTCGLRERMRLELTGGFTGPVAMPAGSAVTDPGLSYDQTVVFQPAGSSGQPSLGASRDLQLKTVEFSPAQYVKLKQMLKAMGYDARKSPILATTAATHPPAATPVPAAAVATDAEILSSRKTLAVMDAHTAVYTVKYAKRILSYNGKIREAEVKIDYNPACESVTLVHAEVVAPNGGIQVIAPGEINRMDQGWNASAQRYTGGKVFVANLPGVEIGSRLEVEYAIAMTNRPFLAGYEPFQFPDGLDQKRFEITAPAGVKLQHFRGGAAGSVREQAEGQGLVWSVAQAPALPAERQLPPDWVGTPGVGYFIGNAADYWRGVNATMREHARHATRAAAAARALTASLTNRLDALTAIRDFIVTSVRGAGPNFTELPLGELSDADTTLADGYGHAADRAILFHAMLTAAGFEPAFVLASDLPPIPALAGRAARFPLPQAFQTPLVRVTVAGRTYYLNDTDQYARLGTTAADGKLGLDLDSGKLTTVHAVKGDRSRTDTVYTVRLTDDGQARITVAKDFYGLDFNQKKRFFAELPPEERNRYHQGLISALAQGARPAGDLLTRFDTYPGHEEFTAEVDHYAVVEGKYCYFDAPSVPALLPVGPDQRVLPLYLPAEVSGSVRSDLRLPPDFSRVILEPRGRRLRLPGGSRDQVRRVDSPGRCVLTDQFEVVPSLIAPRDYPAVQQAQSAMGERAARLFLLQ